MALDDKVFQSAIARINKIKAKQCIIPQIQVFEDPPHLKKSIDQEKKENVTPEAANTAAGTKTSMSVNIQSNNFPVKVSESIENEITLASHNAKSKIPPTENSNKKGTEQGTNQGTKSSTEKGTELPINQTWVQKKGTNQGTITGTNKGTEKGYNIDHCHESPLDIYPDFIYRRSYDSLIGIPKKIVDVIFYICRKYGTK
jgi:hypothetical protein